MLDSKHAEIYVALWRLNDQLNPPCWVLYQTPDQMSGTAPEGERLAQFFTHYQGELDPRIWVERYSCPANSSEPDIATATLDELISLAHERGHEASWRAGTYVATYEAATLEALAEEQRAWRTAESLLRERGFEEWTPFEAFRRRALATYETPTLTPR